MNNKLKILLEQITISPDLLRQIGKEVDALINGAYEDGCQQGDHLYDAGYEEGYQEGYDVGRLNAKNDEK